jgi:plastocyanin
MTPSKRSGVPGIAALALPLLLGADTATAQPGAWTPNTRSAWVAPPGSPVFVFAHRFEFISGGDELLNIPTLTLGSALTSWIAAGLDFNSNTEIDPRRLGGNELELWAMLPLLRGRTSTGGLTAAYNTAARSVDAAVTARLSHRRVSLVPELRAFSNAFASGEGGFAAALGGILRLTPYLRLSADLGRALRPDTLSAVWSGGIWAGIPGTPHSFSLHATNGGATTLQGTSHPKVLGREPVRYGFSFTVPLGTRSQWGRIFRGGGEYSAAPTAGGTVRVAMRDVAFAPREVRVRVGDTVEWVNADPLVHTVSADDGSWESGLLAEGARFTRTFDAPGRFRYHCAPHPQMTGVVIVER